LLNYISILIFILLKQEITFVKQIQNMSETIPPCPQCKSQYAYPMDALLVCPECGHEWNPLEVEEELGLVVKDANGNPLSDGDTVVVLKNLPVKNASFPIKAGTKVKNIRLTDGDHNIDCKIDGFGAMSLKSEFVRKA
jgi:protein PhnA